MPSSLPFVTILRTARCRQHRRSRDLARIPPANDRRQPPAMPVAATPSAGRETAGKDASAVMTPGRLRSLRHLLSERALAALLVIVLALSYGGFAVVAAHSARSNGGALQAADFDTAGVNPWEPALGIEPPSGQSLAHLGARGMATP